MVERQVIEADLSLHVRAGRLSRQRLSAGPLRSLRRRQTVNPLVLAALVAAAVVMALAIPYLVGRTPALIVSKADSAKLEPRLPIASELPRAAIPLSPPPVARAASLPDAPKPSPVQARAPSRPAPPPLSLDMLPILTVGADEPDATKPTGRKTIAPQRRPDPSLRLGTP